MDNLIGAMTETGKKIGIRLRNIDRVLAGGDGGNKVLWQRDIDKKIFFLSLMVNF